MFTDLKIRARHVHKALAVGVITASGAVAQGLIVGEAAAWVMLVVGALATAGVYRASNTVDIAERLDERGGLTIIDVVIIATFLLVLLLAVGELPR